MKDKLRSGEPLAPLQKGKHTSATSMADYVKALKASEFGGSKGHVKSRKARKALAIAA